MPRSDTARPRPGARRALPGSELCTYTADAHPIRWPGGGEKPPEANPGVAGGQCDVMPLPSASGMAPSGVSGAVGSMLLSTFLSPS